MTEFRDLEPQDALNLVEWMNTLPFVRWDRIIPGDSIAAYGWIERDDGRSDFVLLEFNNPTEFPPGFTTSSAAYSGTISHILYGDTSEHNDCERIEDVFGGLVTNAIRLVSA